MRDSKNVVIIRWEFENRVPIVEWTSPCSLETGIDQNRFCVFTVLRSQYVSKLSCHFLGNSIMMSIIPNNRIICSLSNPLSYNPLIKLHFHFSLSPRFRVVAFVFKCAITMIAKGLLLSSSCDHLASQLSNFTMGNFRVTSHPHKL